MKYSKEIRFALREGLPEVDGTTLDGLQSALRAEREARKKAETENSQLIDALLEVRDGLLVDHTTGLIRKIEDALGCPKVGDCNGG